MHPAIKVLSSPGREFFRQTVQTLSGKVRKEIPLMFCVISHDHDDPCGPLATQRILQQSHQKKLLTGCFREVCGNQENIDQAVGRFNQMDSIYPWRNPTLEMLKFIKNQRMVYGEIDSVERDVVDYGEISTLERHNQIKAMADAEDIRMETFTNFSFFHFAKLLEQSSQTKLPAVAVVSNLGSFHLERYCAEMMHHMKNDHPEINVFPLICRIEVNGLLRNPPADEKEIKKASRKNSEIIHAGISAEFDSIQIHRFISKAETLNLALPHAPQKYEIPHGLSETFDEESEKFLSLITPSQSLYSLSAKGALPKQNIKQ